MQCTRPVDCVPAVENCPRCAQEGHHESLRLEPESSTNSPLSKHTKFPYGTPFNARYPDVLDDGLYVYSEAHNCESILGFRAHRRSSPFRRVQHHQIKCLRLALVLLLRLSVFPRSRKYCCYWCYGPPDLIAHCRGVEICCATAATGRRDDDTFIGPVNDIL